MRYLLFLLLMICSSFLFSAETNNQKVTADYDEKGVYVYHSIQKGQTLYRVSKIYGHDLEKILALNADIDIEDIAAGQKIRIPFTASDARFPNTYTRMYDLQAIKYQVKKGETLYQMKRTFHNPSIQQLMLWNRMENENLKVGQLLIVGFVERNDEQLLYNMGRPVAAKPVVTKEGTIVSKESTGEKVSSNAVMMDIYNKYPKGDWIGMYNAMKNRNAPKRFNKGKANRMSTTLGKDKNYAMHRYAPIGTIIRVVNPMNKRVVYCKVIGKLPDTGNNEGVVVKLSQNATKHLKAIDAEFLVTMDYFVLEESEE